MGYQHRRRQGGHGGGGQQRPPFACAIGLDHGAVEGALGEQGAVGGIAGVAHLALAYEFVEVTAAAVTAGINHQGLPGLGLNGHCLVAETAQGRVFRAGISGVGGVELHHPAVFVAGQPKGIAQAVELLFGALEGAGGGGKGAAIGIHGLRHLALEVFLGAQHRAPGGGAAGTVGEAADDAIPEAIVVALALALLEHRHRRAAAAEPLAGVVEASQAGDPPVLGARVPLPAPVGLAPEADHP